jgi:hypothetical protein
MISRLLIFSSLLVFISCQKQDRIVFPNETVTDLLTKEQWSIKGAGFDDNLNGIVDTAENQLTDCQSDNTYLFNKGGSGAIQEGGEICNPPNDLLFAWALQNGDKEIVINQQPYVIVRITENELLLKAVVPTDVNFLLSYSH